MNELSSIIELTNIISGKMYKYRIVIVIRKTVKVSGTTEEQNLKKKIIKNF